MPARGVERWLTQRLSHRLGVGARGGDGVCAGVDFLTPHSLVAMLLGRDARRPVGPRPAGVAAARGHRRVAGRAVVRGPWPPTWARRRGRGGGAAASRRYSVARRLAGLFSPYAVQRPLLLTDWREGRDTDGAGGTLDGDLRWQAELWRRLLDAVDAAPPDVRHAETLARLRAGGDGLDLPPRLSLFGHTRLPVTEVSCWRRSASCATCTCGCRRCRRRCGTRWPRRPRRDRCRARRRLVRGRGRPPVARLAGAGCAGAAADARRPCSSDAPPATDADRAARHAAGVAAGGPPRQPRAGRGQAGRARPRARRPVGAGARLPRRGAAGRRAPRGAGRPARGRPDARAARHPGDVPRHRDVRAADLRPASASPTSRRGRGTPATGCGCGWPTGRCQHQPAARPRRQPGRARRRPGRPRAEVLDLAGAEPVRRRFGFGDDDLEPDGRVGRRRPAIRWGSTPGTAARTASRGLDANTWAAGLRRVLLGVAMTGDEHRYVAGRAAASTTSSSGDIDLVGRLRRVRRPAATLRPSRRARARPSTSGSPRVADGVAQLTAVPADRRVAGGAVRPRGSPASPPSRRRTRASDRCGWPTSGPARAAARRPADAGQLPHRHADGLHDGADAVGPAPGGVPARPGRRRVPARRVGRRRRRAGAAPDDRRARRPQRGPPAVPRRDPGRDGDPRGHLHRRRRAHRRRAAAGGAARRAARRAATAPPPPAGARARRCTQHPLQPFDARNLVAGGCVGGGPFSFDRAALAGASAARRPRAPPRVAAARAAAGRRRAAEDVALADLQAFFAHPVRGVPARRLGRRPPLEAEEVARRDPAHPRRAGEVGGRRPDAVRRPGRADPRRHRRRAAARRPAARPLGGGAARDRRPTSRAARADRARCARATPRTVDVDVDLGGGRRLTGTVGRCTATGSCRCPTPASPPSTGSAPGSTLLALSAGHPDENWTAHALGKRRAGATARTLVGPLDQPRPSSGCATSSTSTTAACASRCRCR